MTWSEGRGGQPRSLQPEELLLLLLQPEELLEDELLRRELQDGGHGVTQRTTGTFHENTFGSVAFTAYVHAFFHN